MLQNAEETGECPLCPENLSKKNKILHRVRKWVVAKNLWPYDNADTHLILIPVKHLTGIEEISTTDWTDIKNLIGWAKGEYPTFKMGGGLVIRFGTNSGVTVRHLHFHLITPITNPETGKVFKGKHVNFPIG